MKQKWEMCSTPDLVKIARTHNANLPPPPALINPFAPPAPVLINPFSIPPGGPRVSLQLRPMRPTPPPPQIRPLATPVASIVSPPQPQKSKVKATVGVEKKFQVQVQANAKNVPDAVRQAMIPADPVDPIEAKYREEMKRNQQKARSIESEKCLPTDLLDDEDAEDAADVKITHPPPQAKLLGGTDPGQLSDQSSDDENQDDQPQKPIGHGRDRSKSERHNSARVLVSSSSL